MIPFGSLVVLTTPRGRRYLRRLEPQQDWHSSDGVLSSDLVSKLNFGSVALTSQGVAIRIDEATLEDRIRGIKRQTQIIYPKDIAYICLRLGAGPDRIIVEAGCGSGALTVALSWFCGPTGRVVSHDSREEFIRLTRRNLDWAGLGNNVELHNRDIASGFAVKEGDGLFLDVRTPWDYIEQALGAIKHGATIGFLVPTTEQISKLLLALEKSACAEPEISEILLRNWKPVADRLRPEDRMIAHTGFLIFSRKHQASKEFMDQRPMGTRERKRESARLERLKQEAPSDEFQ